MILSFKGILFISYLFVKEIKINLNFAGAPKKERTSFTGFLYKMKFKKYFIILFFFWKKVLLVHP